MWLQIDMHNSLQFLNRIIHKNLSPLLAYNTTPKFLTWPTSTVHLACITTIDLLSMWCSNKIQTFFSLLYVSNWSTFVCIWLKVSIHFPFIWMSLAYMFTFTMNVLLVLMSFLPNIFLFIYLSFFFFLLSNWNFKILLLQYSFTTRFKGQKAENLVI